MVEHPASSPAWGPTTKLVVALTIVAITAGLVIRFRGIVAPLLMALVLAYLLSPLAAFLQKNLRLSWSLSVGIIYLILLLILIALLTLGGLGLVQQIESLVAVIRTRLSSVPDVVDSLAGQIYHIGPFQLDLSRLDMGQLSSQLLGIIQPLLGSTGTLVTAMATGAAQFLGWALFVLLISYFVLAESGGLRGQLVPVSVPGYAEDIRHLGQDLNRIWNAFLRGQIIMFMIAAATYSVVLTILGARFALAIALLAGLARFVPYVGTFVAWTTLAMVTYFQPANVFGLGQVSYALLCVGMALLIDQVLDNLVSPRVIAQALRVHPAAVLVAAIIAANLIGLLGVVVAAPILASFALFWRYMVRKMLDLDPWPADREHRSESRPPSKFLSRLQRWLRGRRSRNR